jgi:hypothetical protein
MVMGKDRLITGSRRQNVAGKEEETGRLIGEIRIGWWKQWHSFAEEFYLTKSHKGGES